MHRAKQIVGQLQASPSSKSYPSWIKLSDEVKHALAEGLPVVALESTIISHGMPYPQNVQTAVEVEKIARSQGCVPATIAILSGVVHVGLTPEELDRLGQLGHKCRKCSRRDLAIAIAEKGNGATTVSGTMYVANVVGISVFVTGGIGGVHRDVEDSMDISADLTELGRTPVTVICAGVKSILDIPRTLEFLETQGVTVIGFGVEEFPAFFTRTSGCKAPFTLKTTNEVAAVIQANRQLNLESGIVVGVPVPKDQEAEAGVVQAAIDQALRECKERSVLGKDITPFLLGRVNELSKGVSLKANIALIKNNCLIGSQIARDHAKLVKQQRK